MQVRQLFDYDTWTYTYLIWDEHTKEAALIDPVLEQVERDVAMIGEMGLTLKYTMETHIHADHITGGGSIRDRLDSQIVLHKNAAADCADHLVDEGDVLVVGNQAINIMHTPGHTNNDITFITDGKAFTGDTLFVRDCGRTDFQLGDSHAMYHSIVNKLFTLPDSTIVFPAHDYHGNTQSTIGEEKQFNHRTAGQDEAGFVAIMDNLNLPNPKRLDVSVPGNLLCGHVLNG